MTKKKILIIAGIIAIIFAINIMKKTSRVPEQLDPNPRNVTLSGTYVCLPFIDTSRPKGEECVFGLKTDDGEYYMVNFGTSASAMEDFQKSKYIRAKGFVVIKEALSTDHWAPYNMKGIFTITERF